MADIRIHSLQEGHFEFLPISKKGRTIGCYFDEYDVAPMWFKGEGVFVSYHSYENCRTLLEENGFVFEEPGAQVLGDGDQPSIDEDFPVARYNETGFLWEVRDPGVDKEVSFYDGEHEFATLTEAVLHLLPDYEKGYDLTLDKAAELLLELGLILHTGCEIDGEDGEDDETATD